MFLQRKIIPLLLSLLLLIGGASAVAAQELSEEDIIFNLMYGFLLGAQGETKKGAKIIGEIGLRVKNEKALKAATFMAIEARDLPLAEKITNLWVSYGSNEALKMQARLFLVKKDIVNVEKIFKQLIDKKAITQQEIFQQLLIIRDHPAVTSTAERLFLDNAEGKKLIAWLMFYAGKINLADKKVKLAIDADNSNIENYFLQAIIAQNLENSAAALPVLSMYVEQNCNDGITNCTLDAVLWAYSQHLNKMPYQEALAEIGSKTNHKHWALSAAYWYQQWNMTKLARAAFKRADNLFMAKIGLASILEEEQNKQAALDLLLNAKTLSNEDYVLREVSIAQLIKSTENINKAIERLMNAKQTVVNDFTLGYNLALLYEEKGDVSLAIVELQKLTKAHSNNPDAWNALGYVMADNNIDLKLAKSHIEKAIKTKPDNPNIIDSLGWVYYRLGDLETALFHLKKAAGLSNAVEIWAHWGEVLWQLGDEDEAQRVWKAAIKEDADNETLNDTMARFNVEFQ